MLSWISVVGDGVKGSYGGTLRQAEGNVARIDIDIWLFIGGW
jgi:hypothetical protein